MYRFLLSVSFLTLLSSSAFAAEELKGRVETNVRAGNDRSIYMTEFWVPLAQNENGVLYGDLRMMGDNQNNREGNLGVGYREMIFLPVLGDGVTGVNGWLDRRITERGSTFHQITAGAEWLGDNIDLRLNGYLPLSDAKAVSIPNVNAQGPSLAGTGIVVDTNGTLLEEPQHGFDLELGLELGQYFDVIRDHTDSFRVYGGGYYFNGDHSEDIAGWRTRFAADVNENIQIGARLQRDDERGSQGFLEATFRFPFGHKQSYRSEGIRARLDESPERDIDIVTGDTVTDPGDRVAVLNKITGAVQEVLHVDNSAAGGGDGSVENPFNTLAAAQAAASAQTVIYVKRGDGTSTNQNQGIVLDKQGQQLIGSGTNFIYDSGRFVTANGGTPTSILILPASAAPVIGNVNAGADGVIITADDITVAGFTVDNGGIGRDGIVVEVNGAAASAQNVTIKDVTAQNARMGIYLHGTNSGAVSAMVQNSIATSNTQHGIAVYDDTDDIFEVDLGGGSFGSVGSNLITGNGLEDLAIEYDGRTLAAMNNWWGQAGGPVTGNLYYGAPLNDNLVMHWTFDGGTAVDRSGYGYDGAFVNAPVSVGGKLDLDAANFDSIAGADVSESDTGNALTVLLFATPETLLTSQTLISKWEAANFGNNNSWGVRAANADGSNLFFFVSDVADTGNNFFASSDANLVASENAHIAFVFDGTGATNADRLKTYKNAVQLNGAFTGNMPATLTGSTEIVRAGAALVPDPNFGKPFDGLLDDVRIYQRALSATEIQEIYNANTTSSINSSGSLSVSP